MKIQFLFLLLLSLYINAYAQNGREIIFSLDLVRHGYRTPFDSFPTAPHDWGGKGMLTSQGMRQEYDLGVKLRKKYIENLHLLPYHYHNQIMYAYSTNHDRTLMSAQSFLMGLYPLGTGPYLSQTNSPALPSAFQPVPIHPLPAELDVSGFITDTKTFAELKKKYVFTSPDWQAKNSTLKTKFKYWSLVLGMPINDLSQLIFIGDMISIYQLNAVPLPKGLSSADAQQIVDAGKWALAREYSPNSIGDETGVKLFAFITDNIIKAIKQQIKFKYILIMGHDYNILSVMSALHAPLTETPPYASDLSFTLYRENHREYKVFITLDDKPVYIPFCKSTICPLQKFISLVKNRA